MSCSVMVATASARLLSGAMVYRTFPLIASIARTCMIPSCRCSAPAVLNLLIYSGTSGWHLLPDLGPPHCAERRRRRAGMAQERTTLLGLAFEIGSPLASAPWSHTQAVG